MSIWWDKMFEIWQYIEDKFLLACTLGNHWQMSQPRMPFLSDFWWASSHSLWALCWNVALIWIQRASIPINTKSTVRFTFKTCKFNHQDQQTGQSGDARLQSLKAGRDVTTLTACSELCTQAVNSMDIGRGIEATMKRGTKFLTIKDVGARSK